MQSNPPTLLMVEDDPNDVILFRRAMTKSGVLTPVQVVCDGEAAVSYLAGEGVYSQRAKYPFPTLLLLDLKLPRKSGLEVLAWLRKQPGISCLTTVILTSSQESTDISRAYELGANSYLVKPVEFDSLLNLVNLLSAYWCGLNHPPVIETAHSS